jgi:hypothetical protein
VERRLPSPLSWANKPRLSRNAHDDSHSPHAEFTSKIGLVAEEADESLGWLETIGDADLLTNPERLKELKNLTREADELAAIFSKSAGTARRNDRKRPR